MAYSLDIALSGAEGQTLFEELSEWNDQVSLGSSGIGCSWVGWDVESWNTESSSRSDDSDQIGKDDVWLFLVSRSSDSLVPDGIDGSIDETTVVLLDLLDWVTLGEVDRDCSDFFGFRQSLGNSVHNIDRGGTSKEGGVGSHETDGL